MSGAEVRFGRARLAAPGGGRVSSLGLAWGGAAAALVCAGAWAAYAWLAPVGGVADGAGGAGAPAVPPTPQLRASSQRGVAARERDLALLGAGNVFVSAPVLSEGPPEAVDVVEGGTASAPGAAAPPEVLIETDPELPAIAITRQEDAPDDVRAAFVNLKLVGLHRGREGTAYATISLLQTPKGSPPPMPRGAEFTDPSHEGAAWSLARVDMGAQRVVVSRSGVNLALPLFPLTARLVTAGSASSEAGPGEVVIAYRSLDEVVQEMREAGISDADLIEVLTEMKRLEDEAKGIVPATSEEAAQAKLDQILPSSTPEGAEGGAAAPDAEDFARIIRMMASNKSPLDAPGEDAPAGQPAAGEEAGEGDGGGDAPAGDGGEPSAASGGG